MASITQTADFLAEFSPKVRKTHQYNNNQNKTQDSKAKKKQ
jgi:hypothetical protein